MKPAQILLAAMALLFACETEDLRFSHIPKADRFKDTQPISTLGTVSAVGTCNFTGIAAIPGTWTLLLDEQFSSLNNWNIWSGGAYNNELQLYKQANLVLAGGNLSIVAKKETATGPTTPGSTTNKTFNYTSGRIESKTLFSANSTNPKIRMVARIKLPAGYGMWPAFWSYGDPWPVQGEIDILEAKGQEPSTYYTNYFYGTVAGKSLVSGATTTINSSVSLQSCFHVYEMVWEANQLTYYLDGRLVDTKSSTTTGGTYVSSLFGKSQRVVLNLAVGGNFFASLVTRNIVPGTMEIDWLQVYRSN